MTHKEYFAKIKKEFIAKGVTENYAPAKFLMLYYEDLYEGMEDDVFNPVISIDLQERGAYLTEVLDWFYENKFDFDAKYDLLTPLGYAVMDADATMAEYLILHGAKPCGVNNEDTGNNYYMEDLDVQVLSFLRGKEHFDAIVKTAQVLAKNGVTYGRYVCISIDEKSRTIHIGTPEYKY